MRVEKDFEDLFALFNKHNVRYCVVGAYALALYAKPRYTKDVDILVDATRENAGRILAALDDFGFGSLSLTKRDFCEPGMIIQLGYESLRIDLITSIEGLPFEQIWQRRAVALYGKQKVSFIGLEDFITAKRIANRKQDQADIELLEAVLKRRRPVEGDSQREEYS
jgi:predicted nucleotidyltransferase